MLCRFKNPPSSIIDNLAYSIWQPIASLIILKTNKNVVKMFLLQFLDTIESCQTPDELPGICKPLRECNHFVEVLEAPPISMKDRQYIRASKCFERDGKHFVCCPEAITTTVKPSNHGQ